jgi:hypothetical protein
LEVIRAIKVTRDLGTVQPKSGRRSHRQLEFTPSQAAGYRQRASQFLGVEAKHEAGYTGDENGWAVGLRSLIDFPQPNKEGIPQVRDGETSGGLDGGSNGDKRKLSELILLISSGQTIDVLPIAV